MKIAFFHVMKSAGSTVNSYLTRRLLWPRNFYIAHSFEIRNFDWTADELKSFTEISEERVYVHNHVGAWPQRIFELYRNNGWFTFSFYRHPGDQWCSFYHWSRNNTEPGFTSISENFALDDFLKLAWSPPEQQGQSAAAFADLQSHLDLPKYWRELDYVALFTPMNFQGFLKTYFNHRGRNIPLKNASDNHGYEHYRKSGLISDETHELLLASKRYEDFRALQHQTHERQSHSMLNRRKNIFYQRFKRNRRKVVRFVILFGGRAGSTLLTEHLNNNPWVLAFGEVLDEFEPTWPNQRRWLKKFYLKLPRQDPTIRVIGFKTKYSSISRPEEFRQFFEKHQVKVIHMHRKNPVKLAVSVVRARRLREKTGRSNQFREQDDLGAVNIPIEEFRQALNRTKEYQRLREYVNSIASPKLELTYEHLLANPVESLKQVSAFLEVAHVKTQANVIKATPDDLRQAVSNIDEIRDEFPELKQYF